MDTLIPLNLLYLHPIRSFVLLLSSSLIYLRPSALLQGPTLELAPIPTHLFLTLYLVARYTLSRLVSIRIPTTLTFISFTHLSLLGFSCPFVFLARMAIR